MIANSLSPKTLAYIPSIWTTIFALRIYLSIVSNQHCKGVKTKLTKIMTLWPHLIRYHFFFSFFFFFPLFTINIKASNCHNSQQDYLLVVRKCKHIHKVRSRRTVLLTFFFLSLPYFISSHQRREVEVRGKITQSITLCIAVRNRRWQYCLCYTEPAVIIYQ